MDGKSSSVLELFPDYKQSLCHYNNCFVFLHEAANRTQELLDTCDNHGELVYAERELKVKFAEFVGF